MPEQTLETKWTHKAGHGRNPGTLSAAAMAKLDEKQARSKLYEGITVNDMTVIFRMDRRTILSKIASVKPCGVRDRFDIYQIRDIAPHLVRPAGSIEDYIKKMRHNDLPPMLTKEFWNGQRAKQRFMEDEGELWRTDRVVETLAGAFKTVKMNLLLMPDAVERKNILTDAQRDELRALIDGTLEGLREALIEGFSGDAGPGDGPGTASTELTEYDDFFDVPQGLLDSEDDEL